VLLCFTYFAIGLALGAWDIERGVFAAAGKLARRWYCWATAAILIFFALIALFVTLLSSLSSSQPSRGLETATNLAFAMSCAASSLAVVAVFARFAQRRSRVFDSLSTNAYGIYIVHYVFVSWLQFGLLGVTWSGATKGSTVFCAALLLSWASTAILRLVPAVARII
jgi:surface polysaccharide O-acyltransferase-like enzyme